MIRELTRRELLARGSWLLAMAAAHPGRLLAAELAVLDVAYAGSMGSLMEGPVKAAAAQSLKLEVHGRAQGSNALAQLIVGGSIAADVFIPITPGPMLTVLHAGKAEVAHPFAHTEMVIAYSPKSRFAAKFDAAAKGQGNWWEILQEPGLRFGRTDPATDPQGRNILFTMMLAAQMYKQPDLVEKTLGETINQAQIFTEPTVEARLQSGELDAASAYKTQPGPFNLPYLPLPREINLSGQNVRSEHPDLSLSIAGKTYQPEPLIFYAAALKGARNAAGAVAFTRWLQSEECKAILRRYAYDPAGDASELHA